MSETINIRKLGLVKHQHEYHQEFTDALFFLMFLVGFPWLIRKYNLLVMQDIIPIE